MFGREPIIRDENIGAGGQGDVAGEVPEGLGCSPVEPAPMHVNDRGSLSILWRLGPPAADPADGSGFEGHILRDRDALHDFVERTASSYPLGLAFHWRDHLSQSGHRSRIFLGERMYNRPGSFRSCIFEGVRLHSSLLGFQITFLRNQNELARTLTPFEDCMRDARLG